MANQSIGDVINEFLKNSKWQNRLNEIQLKKDWEIIMGKTIAKYTNSIQLKDGVLILSTDVAPLKQELQNNKERIIININEYYQSVIIKNVIIRS